MILNKHILSSLLFDAIWLIHSRAATWPSYSLAEPPADGHSPNSSGHLKEKSGVVIMN